MNDNGIVAQLPTTRTLVLRCSYDGTDYAGIQLQPNAVTIQQRIQEALLKRTSQHLKLVAAGRTDAGVHARAMILHTKIDESWSIPEQKIAVALNTLLPADIRITGSQIRTDEFHARYSAISREYTYTLSRCYSPLYRLYRWSPHRRYSREVLDQCAKIFLGKHDFTAFSKLNPNTKSYVCNVEKCFWNHSIDGVSILTIRSNRFVYGMVRTIVGAMVHCSQGNIAIERLAELLMSKNRDVPSTIAPAHGLIFETAFYPKEYELDFSG